MLTVHGNLAGVDFTMTWNGGKLSGDDWAVDYLTVAIATMSISVHGLPTYTGKKILSNPWATYAALYRLADDLDIVATDEPTIPPVPQGIG